MDEKERRPTARKKRQRCGQVELERRRREAEDMLSVGIPPGDVVRQLATRYEITERQAENYLTFVYERWRRQAPRDDGSRREQLIKMAHTVFTGAIQGKKKDWRGATTALQILIRLYGLGLTPPPADFLAKLPPDKDRFAGDRNYQILVAMRDQLAERGAGGDARAAAQAASISATISDLYGVVKGAVTNEAEARAVAAAKRLLVNRKYFGQDEPATSGERVDDFAHEQEKPKEEEGDEP